MVYQYPVEMLQAALEKGVSEGLFKQPSGEGELSKALSSLDNLLSAAMDKYHESIERQQAERLKAVKVADAAEIPFAENDLLFINTADQPGEEVKNRIRRCEFDYKAICFIGTTPDWVEELVMTGHRVYEIPADTVLTAGQSALKPHPSSIGIRWLAVTVGDPAIQLN